MKESQLLKLIQLKASQLGQRVFRNNVGLGWIGKAVHFSEPAVVTVMPGDVVIRAARPLHAGLCDGSSDLIGWGPDGKFIAYECKTDTGRLTDDQRNFIDAVNAAGGIAKCVRSVDDI